MRLRKYNAKMATVVWIEYDEAMMRALADENGMTPAQLVDALMSGDVITSGPVEYTAPGYQPGGMQGLGFSKPRNSILYGSAR